MNFKASESSIVHGFQAFYYELLRHKEKALSLYFSAKVLDDQLEDESKTKNGVEGAVVEIQKKMLYVIENVTSAMLAKSRIVSRFVDNAKYIMTVLADEIFLNLKWEGAKFWRFTLLEKQIFQTEIAGDKIFSMMDETVLDITNEEMAFLYLMALSLGFKGRYRDMEDADEQISWYKDRLYAILSSKPARLFFPGRIHMIDSCYEYTNTGHDNSYLPDTRFWSWCIVSVVFVYIVISYFVWCRITGDIGDILNQIAEQTRQSPMV